MAAEVIGPGNIEVPPWLKSLPVAPEYHPTLLEFQDPISYIFKIEKEASKYGICKIVPPVSASSRKTVISNFTKSLLARSNDLGPTFTTRKQQVGFCPRKHRPVQKSVWQSGERYALVEFELKAKNFEKNYLKKCAKKGLTPLDIEALYWNAMADKPFEVEYANDMPGSAFMVHKSSGKRNDGTVVVGETDWNMRRVSRDNLSLLKFMREEIPGVTSPMVYVAMMFSWFAWHVEDHDFHSMNYLHMGSSKTWYGVPREAAVAFEEVIREHGYGGDINPLVTFATLGEKTTVMSPEVLLNAGVPCCRLVQNAGEFVVTFPRAYHSGFSHGFNCGEAANIATPEWLRVAKDAAIRRAAINCPPMVSHFQLLYDLVLSFCSSIPKGVSPEPRSTRLKDRKKTEGEKLVKELFLEDMLQNNEMLHVLGKGSSVVLLPQNFLSHAVSDSSPSELQSTAKSSIFPNLSNPDHKLETTSSNPRDRVQQSSKLGFHVADRITISSLYSSSNIASQTHAEQTNAAIKRSCRRDQGLFSCVSCGILCYACVAIVRPTDEAARYIASADCSVFNCWDLNDNDSDQIRDAKTCDPNLSSEFMLRKMPNGFHCVLASGDLPRHAEQDTGMVSNIEVRKGPSSLGLLALEYGNSSDSEEDEETAPLQFEGCVEGGIDTPEKVFPRNSIDPKASSITDCFLQITDSDAKSDIPKCENIEPRDLDESNSMMDRHQKPLRHDTPDASTQMSEAIPRTVSASSVDTALLFSSRSDEDSSRLHVFCLQHALQVQKQLSRVGGAHVFLACHPEYPKLESHAKKVAEELGSHGLWSEVSFHQSTGEDEEIIRLALKSENAVHGNRDWAVKLGINLFYSANLSRSPLYSKQMHYNSVIYVAFGRTLPTLDSPETKSEPEERVFGRQRKVVVAGKWCGKLWMSSQAHPFLVNRDAGEQEDEANVAPVVKPDLKYARRSRRNQDSGNVSLIGTGNKNRKNAPKNLLEEKSAMPGNMDDNDDEEDDSCLLLSLCGSSQNFKRKRGSRKVKEENVNSETLDEPSEGTEVSETCKQHGNRRKKETCEDEDSSEEFPLSNTWKRIKAQLGALRTEKDHPQPTRKDGSKMEFDPVSEAEEEGGPSTRLRMRTKKPCNGDRGSRTANARTTFEKPCKEMAIKKSRALKTSRGSSKSKVSDDEEADYPCDMDGCSMSFGSKHELGLHKRNICPVKGCGKKFFSHKYLVQHRRVHVDDRPLKCPWRGCKMTFKWAWARTEHIRVHTGDRPYVCTETGCGQTFRFVSDFSRHKRKTGHTPKKIRG